MTENKSHESASSEWMVFLCLYSAFISVFRPTDGTAWIFLAPYAATRNRTHRIAPSEGTSIRDALPTEQLHPSTDN